MDMTRTRRPQVDDQLMRALREGPGALPADLDRLRGYLQLIGALLAEKAHEREPDWAQALAAGAEIETLQVLEQAVVEKAIGVPARTLWAVLTKLAIWQDIEPGGDDAGSPSQRDRLVVSARRDVERLARSGPGRFGLVGPY